MSYSFREPEWPAVCECKYDEARDEMNREDCPFHYDLKDNSVEDETGAVARKGSVRTGNAQQSAA